MKLAFLKVLLRALICILLLSLKLTHLSWADFTFSSEMGYQSSYQVIKNEFSRSLLYFQPAMAFRREWNEPYPVVLETQASLRGWVDAEGIKANPQFSDLKKEINIRNLSFSLSQGEWRLTAGFQEIPWGETFGFSVLDIVNPRDFRDPLVLDPSWVRLPVAAIQQQFFLDRFSLQAVLTPISRSYLYPTANSIFNPIRNIPEVSLVDPSESQASAEYGGRIGYLFQNGLDASLIYFRHSNRNPVYSWNGVGFNPVYESVHTAGGSLSYSLSSLVFRMDSAFHSGQPLLSDTLGRPTQGNQWQNVLGMDFTSENDWSLGMQVQRDWSELRVPSWWSSRISHRFWDSEWETELFLWSGFNNSDRWIQPRLNWNFSRFGTVSVRADWVRNSGSYADGYLWTLGNLSRLFVWISLKS